MLVMANGSLHYVSDELYHHGIKGMKWGVRRFRKESGGLTAAGKKRYADDSAIGKAKSAYKADVKAAKSTYKADVKAAKAKRKEAMNTPEAKAERAAKIKKGLKVGAAVAGTALAAYGAYKVNQYVKTKNAQIAAKKGYEASERLFKEMSIPDAVKSFNDGAASVKLRANSGQAALESARAASKTSFGQAARNVVNYKKSGGNLSSLRSVNSYTPDMGSVYELYRKKKG